MERDIAEEHVVTGHRGMSSNLKRVDLDYILGSKSYCEGGKALAQTGCGCPTV